MAVPTAIAMPKLGMTMREGTILEWRVAVGGPVTKGSVVAVIESEKAEVEMEASVSGVLRHVYVEQGQTVPCGTLLAAVTTEAGDAFDADAFRSSFVPVVAGTHAGTPGLAAAAAGVADTQPTAARDHVAATPAARKLARERGVDLGDVAGSGPGGRVTREDVETLVDRLASRVEVARGVRLDVVTNGSGENVLLLPGFGTDGSAFAAQTAALLELYRVRVIHPRGVGLSDACEPAAYSVATAAADAAAVCARAPTHVVGASLGAAVAIELALTRPELVRSLALITPFVSAGPRLRAVVDAWCRAAAETSMSTLACVLAPWLFSTALLGDDARRDRAVRGLAQTLGQVGAPVLAGWAGALRAWSGTRGADLVKLRIPTQVVAGADDLLTPDGDAIAAAITGARMITIPDAAHAVTVEAPEAVNEALLAHLRSVPAGTS